MSVNLLNVAVTHLNCDMCDLSGRDAVFWPQEKGWVNPAGDGSFKGYLNSNERQIKSGRRVLSLCPPCFGLTEDAWTKIALDEVDLDRAFNEWRDRNE